MRYCVVKNTTSVIDGSDNPDEIMLENAINAGFSVEEVEILTEDIYLTRAENEPAPPRPPSDKERIDQLEAENLTNMLALVELHGLILSMGGGFE